MRIVFLLIALPFLLFSTPLALLFVGNEKITSRELYSTLGLRLPYGIEVWEEQPVLQEAMASQSIGALVSYYRSMGYFETKITSTQTKESITFEITENKPVTVADITINSSLTIDKAIELDVKDLFNQEKFSASKSKIKKRYHDMGYCNSTFNSKAWVDLETHEAHVLFEVTPNEPCVFGAIIAQSSPNIDGNLSISMLQFEEGDPYTLEAIQKSYENLYAQEAISRVSINDTDRIGNSVPIVLGIEETQKPIRFSAGIGISSDQGLGGQMGIKHRNFLGDFKTLSLEGSYTQIKHEVSAILSVPLGGRYFASGEAGFRDELFDGYRSQSVFEKLSLRYQDTPGSYLISMLFDQAKTYESTNEQAFPNSNLFIPSPMLELNHDTRDKILEPSSGNWLNLKTQGSIYSGISDATYFKTLLSGAHIQSFDEHVVATRIKWGTLRTYEGEVPSSYRFYAGGMNSNRAYTYRDLGPKDINGDPLGFNTLLEGTLEYRFPVYEAFRGVLFSDLTYGGNSYLPDYTLPYWGVGAGIRYVTPIGPIAIDVGVDPNDFGQYAFNFRIGELF
jgi:outer membrane protein assembly factor BamA